MPENNRYGQTTLAEVVLLPEQVFDLSQGQSREGLGQTELPVRHLAEVVFDFSEPQLTPRLELSLYLRPGIASPEVALDLFRLYATVNQLELSHAGAGLMPANGYEFTETEGKLQVAFVPTEEKGARDRLKQLALEINKAGNQSPQYRAIERYEARVA